MKFWLVIATAAYFICSGIQGISGQYSYVRLYPETNFRGAVDIFSMDSGSRPDYLPFFPPFIVRSAQYVIGSDGYCVQFCLGVYYISSMCGINHSFEDIIADKIFFNKPGITPQC